MILYIYLSLFLSGTSVSLVLFSSVWLAVRNLREISVFLRSDSSARARHNHRDEAVCLFNETLTCVSKAETNFPVVKYHRTVARRSEMSISFFCKQNSALVPRDASIYFRPDNLQRSRISLRFNIHDVLFCFLLIFAATWLQSAAR